MNENLIKIIKNSKAISRGKLYTLRNGEESNIYLDLKKTYGTPGFLTMASKNIHKIINKEATSIAAMGIGGIPLASLYGELYEIPISLIRDKPKERGTNSQIEGYIPTEKDKIVILDDVYTTGSSIEDTEKILKSTNAKILKACVILTRTTPSITLPIKSILTLGDIL